MKKVNKITGYGLYDMIKLIVLNDDRADNKNRKREYQICNLLGIN